jgi:hypothetical protein
MMMILPSLILSIGKPNPNPVFDGVNETRENVQGRLF